MNISIPSWQEPMKTRPTRAVWGRQLNRLRYRERESQEEENPAISQAN